MKIIHISKFLYLLLSSLQGWMFAGPRNAKGISEFATSRIPTHFVQKLETYEQFQDFVNGSSKIRVVLISDKQNSTVLYQSLSARYHLDIRFAQAHSSLTDAVSELAVKEFPKLFVFEVDAFLCDSFKHAFSLL